MFTNWSQVPENILVDILQSWMLFVFWILSLWFADNSPLSVETINTSGKVLSDEEWGIHFREFGREYVDDIRCIASNMEKAKSDWEEVRTLMIASEVRIKTNEPCHFTDQYSPQDHIFTDLASDSDTCRFCFSTPETPQHLLLSCPNLNTDSAPYQHISSSPTSPLSQELLPHLAHQIRLIEEKLRQID